MLTPALRYITALGPIPARVLLYAAAAAAGYVAGSGVFGWLWPADMPRAAPAAFGILVALWAVVAVAALRAELAAAEAARRARAAQATAAGAQQRRMLEQHLGDGRPITVLDHWSLGADALALLGDEIRRREHPVVVELGTGSGSGLLAALARERGGRYIGIEHDFGWADSVRHAIEAAGDERARVVSAPLKPCRFGRWPTRWYDADRVRAAVDGYTVDVLVVDGPPQHVGPYTRAVAVGVLAPCLARDAVVVIDDSERSEDARAVRLWREVTGAEVSTVASATKKTAVLRVPAERPRAEAAAPSGAPS